MAVSSVTTFRSPPVLCPHGAARYDASSEADHTSREVHPPTLIPGAVHRCSSQADCSASYVNAQDAFSRGLAFWTQDGIPGIQVSSPPSSAPMQAATMIGVMYSIA